MIVTPDQLIKQYFPEPIETTRGLYDRLDLDELGYSYLDWLQGAEEFCFYKCVNEVDYKLLSDSEKNYWISPRVFGTLVQSSPSKICDQIREGLIDIVNKAKNDPEFARQLQNQIDQEHGIASVKPKVSKQLKSKYNQSGQDAFEFSVQADTRLYLDIISDYNFQPGQKIKQVFLFFKQEVEQGVPYHIVDIALTLTNGHTLTYRTIWCCHEERQRYGAILSNGVIRVNLFADNKKLVDSFEYVLGQSDLKTLALELEKIVGILIELNLNEINTDGLGDKILKRHNLSEEAYALAVKAVIPTMPKHGVKESAEMIGAAFPEAVNQYWESYVLRPDPSRDFGDDLDQMVKDRIPRVTLALLVGSMLYHRDLSNQYFKRSYSKKQEQALVSEGSLRLIYALAAATDFDPNATPAQRISAVGAFITNHLDLMKKILIEMNQWPS